MKTCIKPLLIILLIAALLVIAGCQAGNPLRLAPSESQKQVALQASITARDVERQGTDPHSPAASQLAKATQVALSYTGLPRNPLIEDYDTTVAQAQQDASQRPTPGQVFEQIEGGLSLTAELAILFGFGGAGFGGKKVLDWLKLAREKNKALQEIVTGNELLKQNLTVLKIPDAVKAFKDAQTTAQKSPATKRLVTELKS